MMTDTPDLTTESYLSSYGPSFGPRDRCRSFSEAFALAREMGVKEFCWQGGRYHTRTAEEEAALSQPAP